MCILNNDLRRFQLFKVNYPLYQTDAKIYLRFVTFTGNVWHFRLRVWQQKGHTYLPGTLAPVFQNPGFASLDDELGPYVDIVVFLPVLDLYRRRSSVHLDTTIQHTRNFYTFVVNMAESQCACANLHRLLNGQTFDEKKKRKDILSRLPIVGRRTCYLSIAFCFCICKTKFILNYVPLFHLNRHYRQSTFIIWRKY